MTKGSNPQAVALGKLRWKGKTKAERQAHSAMMLKARDKRKAKVVK